MYYTPQAIIDQITNRVFEPAAGSSASLLRLPGPFVIRSSAIRRFQQSRGTFRITPAM